jgi:hypothetical protein
MVGNCHELCQQRSWEWHSKILSKIVDLGRLRRYGNSTLQL